jgi:hypothetical protein
MACQGGCEVQLTSVPEGLEVAIGEDEMSSRYGPGEWVMMADPRAWLSVAAMRSFPDPSLSFILLVKAAGVITNHAVVLRMEAAAGQCPAATSTLVCPDQ